MTCTDLIGCIVRQASRTGRVRAAVSAGLKLVLCVQVDGVIELWDASGLEIVEDAS